MANVAWLLPSSSRRGLRRALLEADQVGGGGHPTCCAGNQVEEDVRALETLGFSQARVLSSLGCAPVPVC